MNTVFNPSKLDVIRFCEVLQTQLLAAIDRGSQVEIGMEQVTKDVKRTDYGPAVVIDSFYVGAKFKAQFRERGF